ncbi:MAG: heparinase II/III family protein [Polyangia bacterium]|nr:heparinase II/III family protein [Polyangia bacterium]
MDPVHLDLVADATAFATVTVTMSPAVIAAGPYVSYDVLVELTTSTGGLEAWVEPVTTPPASQPPPRMLLGEDDVTRINGWVERQAWAASRRQGLLDRADAFPGDFLAQYGLSSLAMPPEGGQWSMHYVCPSHGADLGYEPPMTHRCPVDGATFSGWPYDQVIYGRQHNALALAARNLGLAWQLTGDGSYAAAARELLLAYADVYESYPIHGTSGGPSGSGARVLAQTLDESNWLVNIAWAYDLIGDSPLLSELDREQVEQRLIRPSAAVIGRNDAGMSNWQAWHNAAIAAAGRALGDPRLVAQALHGPSGFHFHMSQSVLADGFWYEGSWGYHFFTLTPMTYLAEMGERGEFPLYGDPALRSMYLAPVLFAPPDLELPAFNDSGAVDLRGSATWRLEAAYRAYQDPLLLGPLVGESRPTEALFFGVEELPDEAPKVTESLVFEASGYAILRGGTGEDPWWAALDFGPHGGWHGHYDKLNLVIFARGRMLGLDPGSHSYALAVHDEWDRVTLAHNTVVVDEEVQGEAQGGLERFEALPGIVWARANGGEAAPEIELTRDVVLGDGYVVDRFTAAATDGESHRYDWVWHADGALESELSLSPYSAVPSGAGYQYLRDLAGATSEGDARFTFSWDEERSYPGSIWSSDSGVVASQSYDDALSHGGRWSGRLDYDFSAAGPDAYITFRTRSMAEHREEAPTSIGLWIHGDGSGHSFRVRILDSTGESHVSEGGSLDFVGWQERSYEVSGFSHWGGNDDGVIDLPLGSLVLQLDREAGGPAVGNLNVDDWLLTFPGQGPITVETYERMTARARLWIAGQPGTTYVTGEGVGPDLSVPVPFVMARRQGEGAAFDVLHEPHGEDGTRVAAFSSLVETAGPLPQGGAAAGFRIEGDGWVDHLFLLGRGAAGEERVFGEHRTDALLAHVRSTASATSLSRVARLGLVGGSQLEDQEGALFVSPRPLGRVSFSVTAPSVEILAVEGDLEDARLLAPGTSQVTYLGQGVEFHLEGDYVVFARLPGMDTGGKKGCGCAAQPSGSQGASFLLLVLLGLVARRRAAHRRKK